MSKPGMGTIFISIASYRDKLLLATIMDAIDKADYPERLVFGVVEQQVQESRITIPETIKHQVRYLGVNPIEARGACWARAVAMTLYCGEKWFLQIDSHTLFSESWDSYMIENLALCYQESRKPILTGFPSGFTIEAGKIKYDARNENIITTVVKPETSFIEDKDCVTTATVTTINDGPIPAMHLAGGYFFSAGSVVDEVPYDPNFYFTGEEQGLSVRLFTHGWDMFHTANSPLYHLYEVGDVITYRTRHWAAEDDTKRAETYGLLSNNARRRFQRLVAGENLGAYSLGIERIIDDFRIFCGVDYKNRLVEAKGYEPLRGKRYGT